VPYVFFFSGFHADYHRPSDHPEKLAYDTMVKVAHASIDILLGMANLDERPKYAGKARLGVTLPDFLEPSTPPRRMGVTVQELDDSECDDLRLASDQGGLRVEDVHKGSVAEAAGVRIGDVILSIAGSMLARGGTREELRKKITEKVQPGREIEVVVLREGKRVPLKAKWPE
jgi:S1-C subfamily serine protease